MQRMMIGMLTICLAFAAVAGWLPSHVVAQAATPSAETNAEANEALVRRYFEIAADGDLDDLTEVVAPDLVVQTAPPGEGSSLESLVKTLDAARSGLPDFAFQIEELFAEGDLVVVRTTVSGTHLGEFFSSPPTGRRIETPAIDLWRVENGKLAEVWHLEDIFGVMEQIAAASSAAGMATPSSATPATPSLPPGDEPLGETADAATVAANVTLARRFHNEIFEQGNLAVADAILAPGFTWHSDVPPGAEGVKAFSTGLRAAFPDLSLTAEQIVAKGDRVAIPWTLSGTHQGEFLGVPATGNTISTPGIDIYRIEDGKIAEIWTVGDELGLLIQLGAFPTFGDEPAATPGP